LEKIWVEFPSLMVPPMLVSTIKILALLSSLHLMLPAGWCCVWDFGPCCAPAAVSHQSSLQKHSCCELETESPTTSPSPNAATDPKGPIAPAKPCESPCCGSQPTVLVRAEASVDPATALLADVVPLELPAAVGLIVPSQSIHDILGPPLHISHCCWLC
jgi:hypothetical protein